MNSIEFSSLEDGMYEFYTYMNERYVGIPYAVSTREGVQTYIIAPKRIEEFNNENNSITINIQKGILKPINVDVIDSYKKISQ